ncbi:MAG TPA: hypothetical protein PLM93_01880 [Sulfuricurvum sp.]|nr:MAG: hypothetical protein B7Y30_07005 [Campylobacterales bacterium 16-40-21]OZA03568.1 MAG: hypothetical protein B7X89_02570 [Sulfuricurvum sp. 17-40-25]HQS65919.1 hypothetical protein [Sulfuricurvum sp.]HQT35843.1 hypothetical protein [Sulfuricurvum sp.]
MPNDVTKSETDTDFISLSQFHNLYLVLKYDHKGDEAKFLHSVKIELNGETILYNYQQLELFKEELLAFNKGDKNNRLLEVEKVDGAYVLKYVTDKTNEETLFGQTESRAIVKVINRVLGNGYSFRYLFSY